MPLLPRLYRTSLIKVKRGDGDDEFELDMFKLGGVFLACCYEGRLRQPIKIVSKLLQEERKPLCKAS